MGLSGWLGRHWPCSLKGSGVNKLCLFFFSITAGPEESAAGAGKKERGFHEGAELFLYTRFGFLARRGGANDEEARRKYHRYGTQVHYRWPNGSAFNGR